MFNLDKVKIFGVLCIFSIALHGQSADAGKGKKFNKNYDSIKKIFAVIDTHEGKIEV